MSIVAVGIGTNIDGESLAKIAGENGSVVQVSGFQILMGKLDEIKREAVCGTSYYICV